MNIDNFKNGNTTEIEKIGENAKEDLTTMEQVFAKELTIGRYTFRIKKLKGAKLFQLVNTFAFSGTTTIVKMGAEKKKVENVGTDEYQYIDNSTMEDIFNQFGNHFDFAMGNIEFSLNKKDYTDLIINGLYQVPEVEENISIMYKLMFFIYQAVMLFMSISRQQLDDMQ